MKEVTNASFVTSASFIAKNAAAWAGDTAMLLAGDVEKPDSMMRPETLRRFKKEMLMHVGFATGDDDGFAVVPKAALAWLFGEDGPFEPAPGARGNFWWRSEFRKRAGL